MANHLDTPLLETDQPISSVQVTKWQLDASGAASTHTQQDWVAEEVPVALIYNGISHAVMLATPQNLEEFAYGFSLCEQIASSPKSVYGVDVVKEAQGIALHIELSSEDFAKLKDKRRTLTGRTGCGLCGAESLAHALRLPTQGIDSTQRFLRTALQHGLIRMSEYQPLQEKTGATHACAWVDADGEIRLVREDVGRHNALDKLIGALVRDTSGEGLDPASGFILTTSRASYEMVQKTILAGVPMLVAMSAPTGLAIRVAEQAGLTLVGFTRNHQHVVYSHAERLLEPE